MNQIATPIVSNPSHGKRLAAALSIVVGLAVIALAVVAPSLLSTVELNHDIAAQIRRTTGLATRVGGPVRFSLLPQPIVEISDVSLADPSGALRVEAEQLTGYLRLLPLLAGRFEIARASLVHPAMRIDLDGNPMARDSAIGRAAEVPSSDARANARDYTRLGSVEIIGGKARLASRAAPFERLLEDVNVVLDWPNLGAAAELNGGFKMRGARVDVSAWVGGPLDLIRGGESALNLDIKSPVANFSTSGRLIAGAHLQYSGHIKANVASLRQLAELTGQSFPHHGRFADLDLDCDANVLANSAALGNLRLRLDGNDYEGTLAIQNGNAKPLVTGTLATDYLDLAPFLAGLPAPMTEDRSWDPTPLDLADLGFADLDLRVSATRLRLAQMEFRDSALSLITHTGGMDLTLAEATANRGKVKGRVSLAVEDGALALRANGSLKDFRLRPLPLNVDGHHELSGLLSATLALDSTGVSINELMHKLAGHAHVDLDSGEITQLDLDSLLSLGTSSKQSPAAAEGDAKAPLDGGNVALRIAAGRVEIDSGRLQTKGLNFVFGGNASLAERSFDFWALTPPLRPANAADDAATRVALTGSWDAPRLSVERVKPSDLTSAVSPRTTTSDVTRGE